MNFNQFNRVLEMKDLSEPNADIAIMLLRDRMIVPRINQETKIYREHYNLIITNKGDSELYKAYIESTKRRLDDTDIFRLISTIVRHPDKLSEYLDMISYVTLRLPYTSNYTVLLNAVLEGNIGPIYQSLVSSGLTKQLAPSLLYIALLTKRPDVFAEVLRGTRDNYDPKGFKSLYDEFIIDYTNHPELITPNMLQVVVANSNPDQRNYIRNTLLSKAYPYLASLV